METTTLLEARAIQKQLRRSPRKVRLIADAVRGKNVQKALNQLKFFKQDAASDVAKVIKSAAANFRDKFEDDALDDTELVIRKIFVDAGVTLKRIQPAPQGRAHPILKRSCHVTVVVGPDPSTVKE